MSKSFVRWLAALALLLCTFTAVAQETAAPLRVGVMTMRPGEIFWERFGHDAIVIQNLRTGESLNYNFGFFDPQAPDFVSRFARGEMRYQLAVLPTEQDVAIYRHEGRGVSIQWLNLSPAQTQEIDRALRLNAQPQNAFYDYRYFTDNCATRVRDAIDRVLGGQLRSQLESRSQGSTFRSEAVRLADNAWWMRYLFDLGLGPKADTPMSLWQAAFVPGRLQASLAEAKFNGQPVVESVQPVLEHHLRPDAQDPRFRWVNWLIVGVLIGIAYVTIAKRWPRIFSVLMTLTWIKFAVYGLALTYLWGFTVHEFAYANRNLWLLNPLALVPLVAYWRRSRAWLQWSAALVHVALPVVALFESWTLNPQQNSHWIALLVPIHFAMYLALRDLQWRHERNH